MDFFSSNKCYLKILTLASKVQYENGRFVLSFDVFKKQDHDRIISTRSQETQKYEEIDCIGSPCSGEIEVHLRDKKCQFKFTVAGALKPASPLEQGEDVLEYNGKQSESRRLLNVVPTYDPASEGRATIKFLDGKDVKHTVTIFGVPTEKMNSSQLSRHSSEGSFMTSTEADRKSVESASQLGTDGCQVVDSSQTERKSVSVDEETVDYGPSVTATTSKMKTLNISGDAASTAGNLAIPVFPKDGPQVVQAFGSAEDDTEDAVGGETAYDKILSNTSLQCLASVLTPQDGGSLIIHLGVPSMVFEQKKNNYPGDIVAAMFHTLLYWRGEKRNSSQLNQDTNKHLYEDLLVQLEAIRRRDIKDTILKAVNLGKVLEKADFKHL